MDFLNSVFWEKFLGKGLKFYELFRRKKYQRNSAFFITRSAEQPIVKEKLTGVLLTTRKV